MKSPLWKENTKLAFEGWAGSNEQPEEVFWQQGLWKRRVRCDRLERTTGEDFRVFSDQNVEAVVDVVWRGAGSLRLFLLGVFVQCSGGRVLVEGKTLFLGGWLGFLDHL